LSFSPDMNCSTKTYAFGVDVTTTVDLTDLNVCITNKTQHLHYNCCRNKERGGGGMKLNNKVKRLKVFLGSQQFCGSLVQLSYKTVKMNIFFCLCIIVEKHNLHNCSQCSFRLPSIFISDKCG